MTGFDRAGAYSDLLAAVLAARTDPATARFDAEIAAAEASGALDGATARSLRWWQRESVRAVGEHVAGVVPGLLAALVDAERAAAEGVAQSEASWAAATGGRRSPGDDGDGDPDGPGGPGGGGGLDPHTPGESPSPGGVGLRAVGTSAPAGPTAYAGPPAPRAALAQVTDLTRTTSSAGTGAPRQRLLVAGLTVLTDGDRPGDPPSSRTL